MANLPANINAPFFYNGNQQFIGKNIFTLSVKISRAGNLGYSTFKYYDGAGYSNYAVPNGKTLVMIAIMLVADSTSTDGVNTIGFGDTAINDSASAPTNPKDYEQYFLSKSVSTLANVIPCYIKIPAGKYPYLYKQSTSACIPYGTVWCYLE